MDEHIHVEDLLSQEPPRYSGFHRRKEERITVTPALDPPQQQDLGWPHPPLADPALLNPSPKPPSFPFISQLLPAPVK